MSEPEIRAAIKEVVKGAVGGGVVHDRPRWTRTLANYLELLRGEDGVTINGWQINRVRMETGRNVCRLIERRHVYQIIGIHEIDDEQNSDETFQALVSAICQAFEADSTLGGRALTVTPAQVEHIDVEDFGEATPYHWAEISLQVTERVTSS